MPVAVQELRNDDVPLIGAAAANHTFSGVPELSGSWIRQLADIEPSIDGTVTPREIRIAQKIGVRAGKRHPVGGGRQSWPVLKCADCADLPVSGEFPQKIMSSCQKR